MNVRRLSFNILYDVFFNSVKLNDALDKSLMENADTKDDDKSFLKRETTGVIEKIDEIDEVINQYSKVKIKKLNNDILIVFRLAIYELYYMDKVPSFATINEYVNIIKHSKSSKLYSYVNAVLRNIDRNRNVKDTNDINTSKKDVRKKCYFRVYNNHEKEVLNELKNKNIPFDYYEGKLSFNYAKVYKVERYSDILGTDSFKNGDILIEDASSIYLTDKLATYIKERKNASKENLVENTISTIKLLDTCAAPGGKIIGLIDLIHTDYYSIYAEARDISKEKIHKICENVKRLKVSDLKMTVKDASIRDNLDDDKYDVVICDVPCTGLGVIDKKPDIKLNYSDEKRDSLVKIQRKILDASSYYLKRGGILSYSTCTETKEENEDNIKFFLAEHKDYQVLYEKQIKRGDDCNSDGFYMCFLIKE